MCAADADLARTRRAVRNHARLQNFRTAEAAECDLARHLEVHAFDARIARRRRPPLESFVLEHLDERYLKAVGYTTKSKRGVIPKMALFGDIVGDDENAVAQAASEVIRIANTRVGEGFVAVSPEARKKFWLDRAKTAAISKHTNAFKINEDVVIPLDRMGEYTDGIERINIELSIQNKLACLAALKEFVTRGNLPLGKSEDAEGDDIPAAELLQDRVLQECFQEDLFCMYQRYNN